MSVYTVHAPATNGADVRGPDSIAFVRDGFHFWAALFGLLWLLWHRLWLGAIGWLLAMIAIDVVMARLGVGWTAILLVQVLLGLLLGLEAASIRRWSLSRRNWRQLDIVVADNEEAAERRFFDRWSGRRRFSDDRPVDRGAPPPTRNAPDQPFARSMPSPHNEIIGLFPQPGAPR